MGELRRYLKKDVLDSPERCELNLTAQSKTLLKQAREVATAISVSRFEPALALSLGVEPQVTGGHRFLEIT